MNLRKYFNYLVTGAIGSLLLFLSPPIQANTAYEATKKSAQALLAKGDYAQLEALASSIKAKGYDISIVYPELSYFYGAFRIAAEADEAVWHKRREEIEAWAAAVPDSVPARIFLADWWTGFAWKARGTGWASTVSPEGWVAMKERLAKAEATLREIPFEKVDDPEYFCKSITVALGQGWPLAKARRYFDYGAEVGKEYYPNYASFAYWLLPRWQGKPGDWEAFATEMADTFPSPKNDIVYANIFFSNLGYYEEDVFLETAVDYDRIKRRMEAMIAEGPPEESRHIKNRLCYLAAIKGDYDTARPLFFQIRGSTYSVYFKGSTNLLKLRKASGAQRLIDEAYALEKKGDLAGAEKTFVSFTDDPNTNAWLRFFYQRQGMEQKFRSLKTRFDLDADMATASAGPLADLCRIGPPLGLWEQAEAAGKGFDSLRPWNLTGKTTLLLAAAHKGDHAQVEALSKAIVAFKSDRPSYQMVQAVIRGEKRWDDAWVLLKEEGPYNKQSAVALGVWLMASGNKAEARRAFEATLALNESEDMLVTLLESLLFGSLSPLLSTSGS